MLDSGLAGFLLSRLHALLSSHLFFLFLKCIVLFLLEYNCLTLQCQFLLYSKMNQLYMYIYLCFFHFLPVQVTSEHQQSSLCYTGGSHQLSVIYIVVCICQSHSPDSSHFPPFLLGPCLFSMSVSVFAMQIRSSIPFFYIYYSS